ncbi:MAG: MoxR family ATPase [Proteobacteria bacterium]|nr:MAG: MoxR family ATPase [Pseudomonadota bacterium]
MQEDIQAKVEAAAEATKIILATMGERVIGQNAVVERLLMGLIGQGHILLEGLPGLAKTTAVKALGECSELQVNRVQFTPDLLPADVIGTQIFDPRLADFKVKKGPIFTNLLIADEINRAPAKVQSALLEAMQERQVTIADQTYMLPKPFLVLATQNPIEQEGTYPLPEAQLDRFFFKLKVDYSTPEEEMRVVGLMSAELKPLQKVVSARHLEHFQSLVPHIHVAENIRKYIVDIVFATRRPAAYGVPRLENLIRVGASPRASINLEKAARLNALFQGRAYVIPQDVKDIAEDVLRHRIIPSFEAEAENMTTEEMITKILAQIPVP